MNLIKNIFLTGFMGSGKSTLGSVLAHCLGWTFIDIDSMLETHTGKSIPALFQHNGESAFRILESRLIFDVTQSIHQVIALGGGALIREGNRDIIRSGGTLIYLKASIETLHERLRNCRLSRPLLAGVSDLDLQHEIQRLLASRIQMYESADFIFQVDDLSPSALSSIIIDKLRLK